MSKKSVNTVLKFDLKNKLDILKNIRHEIRKKRFILQESFEKFGFDKLTQLTKVKNTSQVKGYPFVASKIESKVLKGVKLGLKIVPIETRFDKNEHPTNLEFIALKELTDNIVYKNISPHIVYYLGLQKVSNKSRALKFLNLKRLEVEGTVRSNSNMLISEYIEGGSLDGWIYDIYENDKTITDQEWKGIVFQLIYTIAIIQKYYRMMHNDFHYGNILIDTSIQKKDGQYFVYTINDNTYYIPNNGFIPKLWDFEFAMVYSNKISDFYPNKFIIGDYKYDKKNHTTKEPLSSDESSFDSDDHNVPYNYNETYDLHYFLTSLLDLYISHELYDWIIEIYPDELIPRNDSSSDENSSSDTSSETSSDSSASCNSDDSIDKLKNKLDKITLNKESFDGSGSSSDFISDNSSSSDSDSSDSGSNSSDSSSDSSNTSDSSYVYNRYLADGRMKNGIENEFNNLPIPLTILEHKFFSVFKNKPADFNESTSLYFKAGF
jgi:serine/threonine protein kinase